MTKFVIDPLEKRIVDYLLLTQQQQPARDHGSGYRSAKEIALAVGVPTRECRRLLRSMAERKLVIMNEFLNGLYWRSTKPLPWEPAALAKAASVNRLAELKRRYQYTAAELGIIQTQIDKETSILESLS